LVSRRSLTRRFNLTGLLDRDNMRGVNVAGVEFVNITLTVGRLPDMAPIVECLETKLLADAPFFEALVANTLVAVREMPRRFPISRRRR
jgi:hypothetical protein